MVFKMDENSNPNTKFADNWGNDPILFTSAHMKSNFEEKIHIDCCIANVCEIDPGQVLTSKIFYVQNLPFHIRFGRETENGNKRVQKPSPLIFTLQIDKSIDNGRWTSKFRVVLQAKETTCHPIAYDWQREIELSNRINKVSHSIEWELVSKLIKFNLTVQVTANIPGNGYVWPSRLATGYSGLKNEGATCYINSLLQSLFHTNEFRRIVYGLEIDSKSPMDSFAFWLKHIFYSMQTGEISEIRTKDMIDCFEWPEMTTTAQQDIHEFLRRLIDKIEQMVLDKVGQKQLTQLLVGELEIKTTCEKANVAKKRKDTFWDLPLSVEDDDEIYGAIHTYLRPLHISDYQHENGKDEAVQHFRFLHLPPVLHIQLNRFKYDANTDTISKNNKPFKFYSNLDLSQLCTDAIYTLHSVLVHSGKVNSGHYVAYISPKANSNWFEFNDDIVTECTMDDAIRYNYGNRMSSRNAYILVYVKDSCKSQILNDVSIDEIVELDLIKETTTSKLDELKKPHKSVEVIVFTAENLQMKDQLKSSESLLDQQYGRKFFINMDESYEDLLKSLGNAFKVQNVKKNLKVWGITKFKNLKLLDNEDMINRNVQMNNIVKRLYMLLFVEICSIERPLNAFDKASQALIFIRQYDANRLTNRLTFVDYAYFQLDQTVQDIQTTIQEIIQFKSNENGIAIFADEGFAEKNIHRKLNRRQFIRNLFAKQKDTCSGTVTFEVLSEQNQIPTYLDTITSIKALRSNTTAPVENGVLVNVKSDVDRIDFFQYEFPETDSLVNIVNKIAEMNDTTSDCIELLDVDNNEIGWDFLQTNIKEYMLNRNGSLRLTRLQVQNGLVFYFRVSDQILSEIDECEITTEKTPTHDEPMDFEIQFDASSNHSEISEIVLFKNIRLAEEIRVKCRLNDTLQSILEYFIEKVNKSFDDVAFSYEDEESVDISHYELPIANLMKPNEDYLCLHYEIYDTELKEIDILVEDSSHGTNLELTFRNTDKISSVVEQCIDIFAFKRSNSHIYGINDNELTDETMNMTLSEYFGDNEAKLRAVDIGVFPVVNAQGKMIKLIQLENIVESMTIGDLCEENKESDLQKTRVVQLKNGFIVSIVSPETKVVDLDHSDGYAYRLDQYTTGFLLPDPFHVCVRFDGNSPEERKRIPMLVVVSEGDTINALKFRLVHLLRLKMDDMKKIRCKPEDQFSCKPPDDKSTDIILMKPDDSSVIPKILVDLNCN